MGDMKTSIVPTLTFALLAGCAGNPEKSPSEEPKQRSYAGKSIGIAAGGFGGIALGLSSAGVLCTIGGPLCAVVLIPAAIVGAVLGGTAGSVVDSVSDSLAEREKAPTNPPRGDTSTPPGG